MPEPSTNPIDQWAAIQQMKETIGWKLLMEKYAKEGEVYLSELLSLETESGEKFTKRDLLAYQLHALGRLQLCLAEFETDAKGEQMRQKENL